MRAVQQFSDEYLARARQASPAQVLEYLEQFRLLQSAAATARPGTKLISLKVPECLLQAFRARCELSGVKYQSQIKALMRAWLGVT